jgi:hypothetical protein
VVWGNLAKKSPQRGNKKEGHGATSKKSHRSRMNAEIEVCSAQSVGKVNLETEVHTIDNVSNFLASILANRQVTKGGFKVGMS